jgi:hypothetical protein
MLGSGAKLPANFLDQFKTKKIRTVAYSQA